jgi:hypothetical protein
MDSLTGPTTATIKRLFAISGNQCAFPKCASHLVDGRKVVGKICHIKAQNEGGPRFDPNQTPEERHGFDNLILMCGRHHDVIDDDEEAYTVEYLRRLKAKHEENAVNLPEEEAEQGATLLFSNQSVSSINQSGGLFAHTINIHNFSPPPSPVEHVNSAAITHEESSAQKRAVALPNLNITRRTEQVIFDHLQSGWRFAQLWEPESQNSLVLWVENEFPTQGNGRDLSNLIASIRAVQYDSFTVSRAYWLQRRDNEVTITSGDKLGVLIGHFCGRDSFISYCNPNAKSFQHKHILDDGFRPLGEKAKLNLILRDPVAMPLRITVTIAQMPSQTVIACRQLIVTLPQLIVGMQECE